MVNVEMMRLSPLQSTLAISSKRTTGLSKLFGTSAVAACLVSAFALMQPTVASAQSGAKPPATPVATANSAQASTKIGFVNTQRILRDSDPAKAAQAKIEVEFEKRNQELQKSVDDLRNRVMAFEKDAPVLPETERNRRQRELGNIDADLQRKQREIQEDFNRRRNEEFSDIIEDANRAIKTIAESENYDLIVQDAVTVSPRVDITDKVLELLSKKKK